MPNEFWIGITIIITILLLVAIPFSLRAMHRWCLRLEERGLLYYSKRPEGSMGPVASELDRMIRPSIEHVEQSREMHRFEVQENEGDAR